jgi:hypothetical protein
MSRYNPIVRTFGQVRAALVESLGVPREEVRPTALLAALIPMPRRKAAWRALRRHGFALPDLLPTWGWRRSSWFEILVIEAAVALWLKNAETLLVALPLALFFYLAALPTHVQFPLGLRTVGDLTLYLTNFQEHARSGYQWTRNEIAFKVRLIAAEALHLPLDEVQPERTLWELGADC